MRKHKIILFYLLTVIIILFVLEIAAKVYLGLRESTNTIILTGDDRVYDHRPSFSFVNRYGIRVHYNSLGLAGEEIGENKGQAFRVLVLGDSITEGLYLPAPSRYTSILEEILNEKLTREVEVVNGAVSGYNSWQELALLEKKGLRLKPDLVIVGICLNDSVKAIPVKYINLFGRLIALDINDGSKARYLDFLYQRSSLYKIIYDGVTAVLRNLKDQERFHNYLKNYRFSISESEWEDWRKPLREIYDLCRRNGIEVIFVIFPLQSQLVRNETASFKPLADFLKENKIHYLDLIDIFRPHYSQNIQIYRPRDLIHPNITGHKIVAEAIAEYIIDNHILD
jgi:lysophospholipase L1-like esterase